MPPPATVHDTITLTPQEQELFGTLLAAVQHAGSGTVLRCAGGWVRDKLLGKASLDIDIALDNKLGKDFAALVNEYLESQGKETRTAAVIHSNPDQSKHLETARMRVGGLWIDLVNLRSETYAQGSRIPTMEFGTPQQDALRRDFTINALFYNINQGMVEDFTGRGLHDLRAGLIRTPLPPSETFLDDPLRVLRAVRFATRFGFDLDTPILEAAASEQVRTALAQKVSKERIGAELEGMFNASDPAAAMQLLQQLSLFPVVFALPLSTAALVGQDFGSSCVACMRAVQQLLAAAPGSSSDGGGGLVEGEERRFALLAGLLLPLRLCSAPGGPKGKPQPASTYIVREALKWRAKDAEVTTLLHEAAPTLLSAYRELVAAGSTRGKDVMDTVPDGWRILVGNTLRRLKQHWRLGMLLAPVLATRCGRALGVEAASSELDPALPELASEEAEAARCTEIAGTLFAAVEALGLQDCWQWKPLLDGKQVMAALSLQKAGPELGKAMAAAMDWQLAHPQGGAEECTAHLQHWWGEHVRGAGSAL